MAENDGMEKKEGMEQEGRIVEEEGMEGGKYKE